MLHLPFIRRSAISAKEDIRRSAIRAKEDIRQNKIVRRRITRLRANRATAGKLF